MIIIITAGKNYDKNMQLGYVYMVYAGSPRAIYSPVKSTGILLGRIASNDRLVVVVRRPWHGRISSVSTH